jgi:hypothetical protein
MQKKQKEQKEKEALDETGRRRKAYRTPRVTAYGNIRDITQGFGTGSVDTGIGGKTAG